MADNEAPVRFVNPAEMARPTGYSHAVEVKAGRTIYISGQVAFDASGKVVGTGDLKAQTLQVFENLKTVLAAVNADFQHIIKVTYYMLDISQITVVREIRVNYLKGDMPASTAVEVSKLVHPDLLIEIEAVAFLPA